MRLKSYFAPSVDEAIERARQELGPEAMLLNSRKIASDQNHLGSYEVVFGITGETLQRRPAPQPPAATVTRSSIFTAASRAAAAPQSAPIAVSQAPAVAAAAAPASAPAPSHQPVPAIPVPAPPAPVQDSAPQKKSKKQRKATPKPAAPARAAKPAPQPAKPAEGSGLADELAELRKQIAAVQDSLSQGGKETPAAVSNETIHQRLLDFDFSDRVARRFLESAAASGQPATTTARLAQILVEEINSRFEVAPRLGKGTSDRRVVMFVGPPGAGKTTTVAKLAVKLGIQRRIPVQLLSLDTMRIGGSEQLSEYARIIGVDFRALYTTAALDEVLDNCAGKKLILIDTPGYAPAEMDEAEENAFFLRRHPEIEVQLVLPASLRASALEKFSERFAVFQPTKLLFTHLDEVDTFGPLLEHAMKTKLPVSYLTHGQSIPQDIEEASKSRLTEGLFARLDAAASAA